MGTLTQKKKKVYIDDYTGISSQSHEAAFKQLINMKHYDLQKACIMRGLEPEELHKKSHPELIRWFYDNFENTEDFNLLVYYDEYMEKILEEKGYPAGKSFRNPILRFSYVEPIIAGTASSPKVIKIKDERSISEPKTPASKHPDWDIMTGTKKYLAYSLTIEKKLPLAEIIETVKNQYPEAEEKSIKIWYKRALAFLK